MKKIILLAACLVVFAALAGCEDVSDYKQRQVQETMMQEATAQTGMPAITNFRERKLLKQILELRDQENLVTYTYLFSMTGKLVFLGETIGYGIPYATQYTNPQKTSVSTYGMATLPQADPNGLFSPTSSEGTWILMRDPQTKKARVVYIEPRIIVSPFPLPETK